MGERVKTILYGAFGRHNFGDLLFPHIVNELLKRNSIQTEIHYCDILSRDMTEYGGHDVEPISDFFDSEDEINVIHVGGQTATANLEDALAMMDPAIEHEHEVVKLKESNMDLAYLLSKSLFKKPNLFVANSVGGISPEGLRKFKEYDFLGFRDEQSYEEAIKGGFHDAQNLPDCAILTKHFFGNLISSRTMSEKIQNLNKSVGSDYIAVQINIKYLRETKTIGDKLKKIISETNLPIVFFCAGIAPHHDSLDVYKNKFSDMLPNDMVHFFDGLNIWDICNVISNAKFVIGTSLHVRILSMQYFRPRVTLLPRPRNKHLGFIKKWDNVNNTNVNLSEYVKKRLQNHDCEADEKQLKFLENEYLTKSTWVNLLK